MNNSIEKLEKFRGEIESDSLKEAEELVAAAKKNAEKSVAGKKDELKAKFESEAVKVTENFRTAEKKRVSEARFAEEKKSLAYRRELTDRFFGEIEKKLLEVAASAEYGGYLKRCAGKAEDYFPPDAKLTAYCRAQDVPAVKKALSAGTEIRETKDIRLGGLIFRCEGQSASVDLSFDAALEKERENFASMKELQL